MNSNFAIGFRIGVWKLDDNTLSATALAIFDDGTTFGARRGLLANLAILIPVVKLKIGVLRGRDVQSINRHSFLL